MLSELSLTAQAQWPGDGSASSGLDLSIINQDNFLQTWQLDNFLEGYFNLIIIGFRLHWCKAQETLYLSVFSESMAPYSNIWLLLLRSQTLGASAAQPAAQFNLPS